MEIREAFFLVHYYISEHWWIILNMHWYIFLFIHSSKNNASSLLNAHGEPGTWIHSQGVLQLSLKHLQIFPSPFDYYRN